MRRTEEVELTVLCLIHDMDRVLLQDRISEDWKGYTLPGGHVEVGESIVDATVREMKEETGLTILDPRLCGVKQFPMRDGDYAKGRYLVFLFEATKFEGELASSEEGTMHWVNKADLNKVNLVEDFHDLMDGMMNKEYSAFQYVVTDGNWNVIKK
ncbi:MAG: 8-oxo-dGTP diphosphatase [Lachnospiraceae bacterium]|nr:8-oxo-dGTP diphosphatase [Lachnospiraceae bacterium]